MFMKQIGLIKWFDNTKGFGKIGTPNNGDVFIHQKNFTVKPDKILKGTAIVFEIQNDIKGNPAINAAPPKSYDDFELILTYLKENPSIEIEITVTRKNRFGNDYKKDEINQFNLLNYSLFQLLRGKQSTEIYNLFINYFDQQKYNSDLIIQLLQCTKHIIRKLNVELNDNILDEYNQINNGYLKNRGYKNEERYLNNKRQIFLIQKIFIYCFNKIDLEILYKIWESKTYVVDNVTLSMNDDYEDKYYEFPTDIFSYVDSNIELENLERIFNYSNNTKIISDIIEKKILNFNQISYKSINDIINAIQIISKTQSVIELNRSFADKILGVILMIDFTSLNIDVIEKFKLFIDSVKSDNKISKATIEKFNSYTPIELQFELWNLTKYYQPNKDFFKKFKSRLSYQEFLLAPNEFHEEYFLEKLEAILNYDDIENFGLLVFLLIEMPLNKIQFVFEKLQLKFQIALWLNFYNAENKYNVSFDSSSYAYNTQNLLTYLDEVSSLDNLITTYELISKIKKAYFSNYNSLFNLENSDRVKYIADLLKSQSEIKSDDLLKITKVILSNSTIDNCILFCQKIIPKFIYNDNVTVNDLTSIVNLTNIDINLKNKIFTFISEERNDFEKVSLWLNGHTNNIDFNKAIEVFDKFPIHIQPLLLRKLFSLIHRGKITSIENCINQFSTLATVTKLNLNVSICLNVIKSLSNQNSYIEEKSISEIVCRFVNENIDAILLFSDFFEECKGRTWISKSEDKSSKWYLNIEGKDFYVDNNEVNICGKNYDFDKEKKQVLIQNENYQFRWSKKEINHFTKLYEIPHGITFCDAVKSEEDQELKKIFYWCNNGKCFQACQTDHNHLEWSKYTLRDLIKILELPFEDDKYYRFVSLINRANRLIKKLKCDSCSKLLRDVRTSEFAFYRVTTFYCTNLECSKYHSVVYLNHCLNWKCLNIVDSRISTVCPNEWYICDKCNNCCSQVKLANRLENLIVNNAFNPSNPRHVKLKYQVENDLGHLEKNEKFDYKTGDKIN